MKVLIGCASYSPYIVGGGEISTQYLAESLARLGVEIVVVAAARRDDLDVVNGIKVYRIKTPNVYWSFDRKDKSKVTKFLWHLLDTYNRRVAPALRKIIQCERPTIFHTSTIEDLSPFSWKVASQEGLSVVHTLRSYTLPCPRAAMRKNGRNCRARCFSCKVATEPKRRLSTNVDMVVGNSQYILDKHLNLGFFTRAGKRVIHNIYEHPTHVPKRRESDATVFGYIGRLAPVKGVELLLRELRLIRHRRDWKLLVAGDGEYDYIQELRQLSIGIPVEFVGHESAAKFFNKIDVTIVPSLWHEPLARVIFESYAHGVPVIASHRGGSPEIVEEGSTGYLFDPDKDGALASILLKTCNDASSTVAMSKACLEKSKEFTGKVIGEHYINAYKSALGSV